MTSVLETAQAETRDFKETLLARVQADPKFREALLQEGIETMLVGDVDIGKAIPRDYVKATVGLQQLGIDLGSSPKSLIRMFGATGNPRVRELFGIIGHLQLHAGLRLHVTAQLD